jgi:Tfp pilus assembly protein PilF
MLQAVGQLPSARTYATASIESAPKEPIVHVAAAALALARKDYAPAADSARHALDLAPDDPGALEMAARISAATGATEQAWNFATRLKSLAAPDDMNVLFLHARIASAAHAYGAEQDSLERLVAVAEKLGLPATDYRVYLGQCYARQGLPRPALDQLDRAARDPDLTDKQRTDLATAIATVRQRAGELSQ